jgi:hypothetical protein
MKVALRVKIFADWFLERNWPQIWKKKIEEFIVSPLRVYNPFNPHGIQLTTCVELGGPDICAANAYGHITLNAPVLVRSPKLSTVERRQYLDGWPPGNTPCCRRKPFLVLIEYRNDIKFNIFTKLWPRDSMRKGLFIKTSKINRFLVFIT